MSMDTFMSPCLCMCCSLSLECSSLWSHLTTPEHIIHLINLTQCLLSSTSPALCAHTWSSSLYCVPFAPRTRPCHWTGHTTSESSFGLTISRLEGNLSIRPTAGAQGLLCLGRSSNTTHCLAHRTNHFHKTRGWVPTVCWLFVNKVLLAHNYAHSFTCPLLSCYNGRVE